jgi:hypothetical protein
MSMHREVFWSMQDYANAADQRVDNPSAYRSRYDLNNREDFAGGTLTECLEYGRHGWNGETVEALEAAERAVKTIEQDYELTTFHQEWDVTGGTVDIPAYLAGLPECMIEYPVAPTVKTGRVVTLCASIAYSCAVSAENIRKRGHVITAFALALSKLGYGLELWVDWTVSNSNGDKEVSCRVMVKGANDVLDPGKVQFAYAHPGVLRCLGIAWANGLPAGYLRAIGSAYGYPRPPKHDLPEGTIYLPEVRTSRDIPNLDEGLLDLLRQSGVID